MLACSRKKYINTLASLCSTDFEAFTKYHPSKIKKKNRKLILENFSITDEESARQTLERLVNSCSAREFESMKNKLLLLSREDQYRLIESFDSASLKHKYHYVRLNMNRLTRANIAGFDYSTCIKLSQFAKLSGFLTRNESEALQLRAAKNAQKSYSNWTEYLIGLVAGSHFNKALTPYAEEYLRMMEITTIQILSSPHSTLEKTPWETSLD